MIRIDCEQRSTEWFAARRGIPTATGFKRIMTPKTMKPASAQDEYIDELIAERLAIDWPPLSSFVSDAMLKGILKEVDAQRWYAFDCNCDVESVGFCLSDCGRYGCSPDGLLQGGGLEIKVPDLKTHIGYLRDGVLPSDYICQVHGSMFINQVDWWDFMSYNTDNAPQFVLRVKRDKFTDALGEEIVKFCDRLDEEYAKVTEGHYG